MKATGIVRRLDSLGRIVLPKEIRDSLDIKEKDSIEIFVDGKNIVLRKYEPACIFCGSDDDTFEVAGKVLCKKCIDELRSI